LATDAGVPPAEVAARLRSVLDRRGVAIPPEVATAGDPFDVLRHASTLGADLAAAVHSALVDEELAAVTNAAPTDHAVDVLQACRNSRRSVAIVSNNSTTAVTAYVEERGLSLVVDVIIGRNQHDAALLKPAPHLVAAALRALGASAAEAIVVGDSPSDIEAARAMATRSIGYANKPGKAARLRAAGADAVIETMETLARAM
jgi:phosphoglycolate phosphatase